MLHEKRGCTCVRPSAFAHSLGISHSTIVECTWVWERSPRPTLHVGGHDLGHIPWCFSICGVQGFLTNLGAGKLSPQFLNMGSTVRCITPIAIPQGLRTNHGFGFDDLRDAKGFLGAKPPSGAQNKSSGLENRLMTSSMFTNTRVVCDRDMLVPTLFRNAKMR